MSQAAGDAAAAAVAAVAAAADDDDDDGGNCADFGWDTNDVAACYVAAATAAAVAANHHVFGFCSCCAADTSPACLSAALDRIGGGAWAASEWLCGPPLQSFKPILC